MEPEDWDWYPIECPVCGSDGILSGETNAEADIDEDGNANLFLSFIGETFKCEQCGLELADYDEMKIAGVEPVALDRSDESDQWQEDNPADDYEGL